ncbi:MAG: rhodanese-like domain-containing protein [Myxococcota bacterium]
MALVLLGCKGSPSPANDSSADEAAVSIAEITVENADKAIQSGAVAIDANSASTRKKHGTVPEAVMLTSSSKYDLSQLPEDKSKDLIFYCSSTFCTASDNAAERAQANGYEHVHIMREGIKGWKEAGKPTKPFTDS